MPYHFCCEFILTCKFLQNERCSNITGLTINKAAPHPYYCYRHKDHYTWNKATTCVHNLLGGQRWVDHYGEVVIRNHSHGIKCKLTYAKVRHLEIWHFTNLLVCGFIILQPTKVQIIVHAFPM